MNKIAIGRSEILDFCSIRAQVAVILRLRSQPNLAASHPKANIWRQASLQNPISCSISSACSLQLFPATRFSPHRDNSCCIPRNRASIAIGPSNARDSDPCNKSLHHLAQHISSLQASLALAPLAFFLNLFCWYDLVFLSVCTWPVLVPRSFALTLSSYSVWPAPVKKAVLNPLLLLH